MGALQNRTGDAHEHCPDCSRETAHSVSLQIRTESTKEENAEFSREPYRVCTCTVCGHETAQRMNNA
ncbi:hypothetical protein BRC94_05785 [Halobacteriales archaeon QS_5_70_17]|nr:MAG: hypothetical protein BRC94_05785 [Halobacteriales archaeon QS_5_70_17]